MLVLGIAGGLKGEDDNDPKGFVNHDAAAVLLEDGNVIAAIEEERLSRVKHSNCFPVKAINSCLAERGVALEHLHKIAVNTSEGQADLIAKSEFFAGALHDAAYDGRQLYASMFRRYFRKEIGNKLHFCNHQFAHAWSAFLPSAMDAALVLSIDGDGDDSSGMVFLGQNGELKCLRSLRLNQSLGHLYQGLSKVLGYDRFDEYKVMGLAPYGNPATYACLFDSCCRLLPEGSYELDDPRTWFARLDDAGLLKKSRRRGDAFQPAHIDFAAALQATLEKIVLHVLRYFRTYTNCTALCMAGGVAHNCTLNGKILSSGLFDQVFVQPAAHDAGGALGAALEASLPCNGGFRDQSMTHVYFGTNADRDCSVYSALTRWKRFLDCDHVKDVAAKSANLLAEGAVVGWVQGRAEFGPRALGNRSILADPRPASNKERINQMVKKREAFRPFAPSVLEEQVGNFFVVPNGQTKFPFMVFALQVRPEMQSLLGAITHVDGTARIQTVSRHSNPLYWRLLREFQILTGVPILLNTSFNNNAEPIVNSVDDAVACFLTTGLDYLIVGDFIVKKQSSAEVLNACASLVAELPMTRKLVKKIKHRPGSLCQESVHELESTKSDFFGPATMTISPEMYHILRQADAKLSLHELMLKTETCSDDVITEAFKLWTARMIRLLPASK